MSDAQVITKNGQMHQNNPISKPPLAINIATKANDIEDDLEALQQKQAHTQINPSPVNPDTTSKSPNRPMIKSPAPDTTPNKIETKARTLPTKSLTVHRVGPESLYDPFEDIASGKNEEEVINKLKNENVKLRKELKTISDDLTVLVDKKRYEKKEDVYVPHARDYIAGTATSEKGLQSELETATKQLARLQKEVAQLGTKCDAHGTYEKFQARQAHLYETESKIQEILNQKKVIEKTIREKEKALDQLLNNTGPNFQVISMDEDARLQREKAREIERRKEHLEKQAVKRKEYTQKLVAELEAVKQDLKKAQDRTGLDPKDIKIKPESPLLAKINPLDTSVKSTKKIPMFKQVEEELPCTEENFEKLKKEMKIMQKAEEMKNKKNDRETGSYQSQIATIEKNMEEGTTRLHERKKEIDLLQTKLKDLNRIVRHHAVLPLQEEQLIAKELPDGVMKRHTSPGRGTSGRTSPGPVQGSKSRSTSKAKNDRSRPKPYHLLIEYAKHNFQSKGYRKDEKGKPVREEEGVNFNDKDVIGKQKVKIIAMDVWHDDVGITGLQLVYENEKKDIVEGRKHLMNEEKSKKVTFETLEEDYLKEISGFMNKGETIIECLILRTFRGETMRIGAPGRDSKLFKFDINEMEYPAIIYGSIKEDKNNSSKLARLGVLIATQSLEEKIDNKDAKDEKEISPLEEKNDRSVDQKDKTMDNADVVEEIDGDRDGNAEELDQEEQGDRDRTQTDMRDSHGNDRDGENPIEEDISKIESVREKGDPSPRKQ